MTSLPPLPSSPSPPVTSPPPSPCPNVHTTTQSEWVRLAAFIRNHQPTRLDARPKNLRRFTITTEVDHLIMDDDEARNQKLLQDADRRDPAFILPPPVNLPTKSSLPKEPS